MSPQDGTSRRRFLKASGAVAAAMALPTFVPARALGLDGAVAPSNRLGFGFVGVGAQGFALLHAFIHAPTLEALAVCDVVRERREAAKGHVEERYARTMPDGKFTGVSMYADFRELLARQDIDAVVIATPDHWHALMCIAAAKAGKDIYCEKPLAFSVAEGRAIVEVVERYGRVFQTGLQQRSDPRFRFACELVRNGRIGRLKTIRLGVPPGKAIGPQAPQPVPEGFDYDLWLGPAPAAPFTSARCFATPGTEQGWYFISEYSPGWIAGWGVHHVDSAQQGHGTDFTGPLEIEGQGTFPTEGLFDTATTYRVEYRFADGVTMVLADTAQTRMGVTFEGEEGSVFVWREGEMETTPASLMKEVIRPNEIRLYDSKDHQQNFIDCVRYRRRTAAPAEVGHRSTAICHLGAIAMRLGRKLRWDPVAERVLGDAEANRMLARAMRSPWTL